MHVANISTVASNAAEFEPVNKVIPVSSLCAAVWESRWVVFGRLECELLQVDLINCSHLYK